MPGHSVINRDTISTPTVGKQRLPAITIASLSGSTHEFRTTSRKHRFVPSGVTPRVKPEQVTVVTCVTSRAKNQIISGQTALPSCQF